jgi:hypothetical protein
LAVERIKKQEYQNSNTKLFFGAPMTNKIRLVRRKADALAGFEFKWNENKS